ncbi:MAG: hypothetical protein KKB25_00955 [Nanoarchaeota archaeon]|nr:hypothetical protein [Nanoarchaeota archaeon]
MPLKINVEYTDAPGVRTNFKEGKAGILQLFSEKRFSSDHILNLDIYKTTLYEGCELSSKLLPLVVGIWEKKENEILTDFYSFDNNGICLSHGYSRKKGEKRIIDEEHDTDISRLIEHGEDIKEMIGDYPIPVPLLTHPIVMDLRINNLRK